MKEVKSKVHASNPNPDPNRDPNINPNETLVLTPTLSLTLSNPDPNFGVHLTHCIGEGGEAGARV